MRGNLAAPLRFNPRSTTALHVLWLAYKSSQSVIVPLGAVKNGNDTHIPRLYITVNAAGDYCQIFLRITV
jgi:hypothetical protein